MLYLLRVVLLDLQKSSACQNLWRGENKTKTRAACEARGVARTDPSAFHRAVHFLFIMSNVSPRSDGERRDDANQDSTSVRGERAACTFSGGD